MSQQDIANLNAEDVDWQNGTETGMPVIEHLGAEALNLFKDLLGKGFFFRIF